MLVNELQNLLLHPFSTNHSTLALRSLNNQSRFILNRSFSNTPTSQSKFRKPRSPKPSDSEDSTSPNPKLISALRRQALANADSTYESLPPVTSGFDSIKLSQPRTLLKPRLHLSSFPKLGLKITRPAKDTQAYGLNFGVMPRPPNLADTSAIEKLSKSGREEHLSLVDRLLRAKPKSPPATPSKRNPKNAFGSTNTDPTIHCASTPLLPISHKKLQKLADLMNRYRMTVEEALLQLKFSHKAVASKVLDLLLEAREEAVGRGLKREKLVVAEAWVTKGFHTTELQVRARGRHGQITHPSAKLCVILRESESRTELKRRAAYDDARKRVRQRGVLPGAAWRLPADGVVPTSIGSQAQWAW